MIAARYAEAAVKTVLGVPTPIMKSVRGDSETPDSKATQLELSAERDRLRLLLEVTNALVSKLDLPDLIAAVSSSLQRAIPHEFTSLDLPDDGDLSVSRRSQPPSPPSPQAG